MNKTIEIQEGKTVYGVSVNSDLNEGRGYQFIKYLCQKEATAIRLAKKADVQGTDGGVCELNAIKICGTWYYEGVFVHAATEADHHMEEQLVRERIKKTAREKAIQKAKELGLSDTEIKALKGE